jgi:hypothetical protein
MNNDKDDLGTGPPLRVLNNGNTPATVGLWSAVLAPCWLLFALGARLPGDLLGVPMFGLSALGFGIAGIFRARRQSIGMARAVVAVVVGTVIILLTALALLYIWAATRSSWQF